MDIKSTEERSKNMAAIKSKNTKPELFFRKLLFSHGFRYSLHKKSLPGSPDLYLRRYNTAIFIHGCFWHRHTGCPLAYTPKSNIDFWDKKFSANLERDKSVVSALLSQNVRVLIVWECTIKKMMKNPELCTGVIDSVSLFLKESHSTYMEI